MSVSAIIPNWNGAARLPALFESLRGQEGLAEVLVIDNGSRDDSAAVARDCGARVIELAVNRGFAAAVNRGVAEARSAWVAVLNNDVSLEPGWVVRLTEKAEANQAWFATGKLLDSGDRGRIDGTYDAICRGATSWRCGSGRADGEAWGRETRIAMAPFTALVARRELFARVGPLDESFESYLEDVDFGIRCALARCEGVYVPEAVAYHQGSATLGRWHGETVRRIARNQLLLVAKHYPRGWFWRYGWPVVVAQTLWGLVAIRHGAGGRWMVGKLEGARRFRSVRGPGDAGVDEILRSSEREIRELQERTGFDWYWKLYFALT